MQLCSSHVAGFLPAFPCLVQPLHAAPRPALVAAIRVGLEAPVLLTQAFLAATQLWVSDSSWKGDRRVLQVSAVLPAAIPAALRGRPMRCWPVPAVLCCPPPQPPPPLTCAALRCLALPCAGLDQQRARAFGNGEHGERN